MTSLIQTVLSFCILSLLLSVSMSGQSTIVISFDDPSMVPTSCDVIFTEEGVPMQLVDINPGVCFFNYDDLGGNLDLFPAKLSVDLSGLGQIERVEVDIANLCGQGCTGIELLNNGVVILSDDGTGGAPITLVLDNSNLAAVDELTLFSFEDRFLEIRLTVIDSDPCAGSGDADNDTVCDALDVCPGFDDRIDRDGNGIPDYCDVCEFNRTMMEPHMSGDNLLYGAILDISSAQVIESGAIVTFDAGQSIQLFGGFEVELGAVFTGVIGGCVPPF